MTTAIFQDEDGVYHYFYNRLNPEFEYCKHDVTTKVHEVVISWGNRSFVCDACGMTVRKELTSTSL
jgi:hypothetical protein